jgi:uncharacterized protein (DUF433 family)
MDINDLIEVDPEKMGGTPVFKGTRVPIAHLFEYLEAGNSVDQFLDEFPTVTREQVQSVLQISKDKLLSSYEVAA